MGSAAADGGGRLGAGTPAADTLRTLAAEGVETRELAFHNKQPMDVEAGNHQIAAMADMPLDELHGDAFAMDLE